MDNDRLDNRESTPARRRCKRGQIFQELGRSRSDFSTKIHMLTDSHGNCHCSP
jgi:hypothetical protein